MSDLQMFLGGVLIGIALGVHFSERDRRARLLRLEAARHRAELELLERHLQLAAAAKLALA